MLCLYKCPLRARDTSYPITGEKLTYILVKTNILNQKLMVLEYFGVGSM